MSDFDDFEDIDFSGVKVYVPIKQGEYAMRVVDWDIQATKQDSDKGKNIVVTFELVDPEQNSIKDTVEDYSSFKTKATIFTMPSNPFAIMSLVAAIKGFDPTDPETPAKLGKLSGLGDKSQWIGEEVGVRLVPTEFNGKVYMNPAKDGYFPLKAGF